MIEVNREKIPTILAIANRLNEIENKDLKLRMALKFAVASLNKDELDLLLSRLEIQ